MLTKFGVKDYSQDKQHNKGCMRAFGGNNVETAPKSFGLCETQLTQILNIIPPGNGFLDHTHAGTHPPTHTGNPIVRVYMAAEVT